LPGFHVSRLAAPEHQSEGGFTFHANVIPKLHFFRAVSALFSKGVFHYPLSHNHLQSHNTKPVQFLRARKTPGAGEAVKRLEWRRQRITHASRITFHASRPLSPQKYTVSTPFLHRFSIHFSPSYFPSTTCKSRFIKL